MIIKLRKNSDMITKITPVNELKLMFLEILLNKTDKINDIGSDSVLNGIAFGCAKVKELGEKAKYFDAIYDKALEKASEIIKSLTYERD